MFSRKFLSGASFFLLALEAYADVYMHNPRGSNDRNCERNVNRNNGNRLFDSQNNNKGGYACPRAVGNEDMQAEDGTATFNGVDITTGQTTSFTQNKRIYYYSGSVLPIEWTEQHGCGGNSKIACEIVIQYACEDTLDPKVDNFWPWITDKAEVGTTFYGNQHFRSGTNIAAPRDGVPRDSNDAATDTIPDNAASAIPNTVETRRFGMQESYDYYQVCQRTERNKGLYTADQRVNRNDQRGTRQNPNGNRRGLECPEERDYYPWWAPSPWIDIAVLTDSAGDSVCYHTDTSACTQRCQYYMDNTMNFNNKGYCDVNHDAAAGATVATKINSAAWQNRRWYNNREQCEANGFVWYEVSHSDNINLAENSFVCAKTGFARANHLGNGRNDDIVSQNALASAGVVTSHVTEGVNANRFMWVVPEIPTTTNTADPTSYFSPSMEAAYKSCVLRIRYNTSTSDFQQWPLDAVDLGTDPMVDSRNNSRSATDANTPLHQDPYVYIGPGDNANMADKFVKLKVNTNQYGRTFQDRSYVFSIKPLPAAGTPTQAANNQQDTPEIDAAAINAALAAGGTIYNVNVRGKRGNIVQTYPAVEYDFVPNALALGTNDMVHIQWTGSDYNPRRGCNDATGGPPDANTFSTDANANQNPRADRSNMIFTDFMGFNVPKDYQGYEDTIPSSLTFTEKSTTSQETILADVPCYNPATDSTATATQCYNTVSRLAYLNQQSDVGSLVLRAGKACLTPEELDAISNQDVADYHPLNCAKMNAKPYPYFDGGMMFMRKDGWFPFFSSRNNNFSNRQQIGVICVGGSCAVDSGTKVLQDSSPSTSGASLARSRASACYDTASGAAGANSNGAHSCLPEGVFTAAQIDAGALTAETTATQEGDNDGKGDGNSQGCALLTFRDPSDSSVEQQVALAFILLAVGLFTSWLAYFLYNRYQARKAGDSKFRYQTAWQKDGDIDGAVGKDGKRSARPTSARFAMQNPGVKMGRGLGAAGAAAGAGAAGSSPKKSSSARGPSKPSAKKAPVKREMI